MLKPYKRKFRETAGFVATKSPRKPSLGVMLQDVKNAPVFRLRGLAGFLKKNGTDQTILEAILTQVPSKTAAKRILSKVIKELKNRNYSVYGNSQNQYEYLKDLAAEGDDLELAKYIVSAIREKLDYPSYVEESYKFQENESYDNFRIVDHGVDHAQYFSGHGTSFTKWDETATGAGMTPEEAVDEALTMIAQQAPERRPKDLDGFISAVEAEARNIFGDNYTKIPKELKQAIDEYDDEGNLNPEYSEESELYYFISVDYKLG